MSFRRTLAAGLLACACLVAQSGTDVGSGSPDEAVRSSFVNAFFRNLFYTQVAMPPLGDVRRLGTTGYVQEFNDAARTTGVRLALIKPNGSIITPDGLDVFHMLAPMYNYYASVGVNTAGYPTQDTQTCPPTAQSACQWQTFNRNYALFAYLTAIPNGQNFSTRDTFFTRWRDLGGITVLGPANSAETSVTSASGAVATVQTFAQGAIFNITGGNLAGRQFAILPTIYAYWTQAGGASGSLGFPTGDELALPDGRRRQAFEGGSVEFAPGGAPVLRPPIFSISLTSAGSTVRLNLGERITLRATAFAASGDELPDRIILYTTSNSRVAAVESSQGAATVRAVGAGSARIVASSEGRSSGAVTIDVVVPCCAIGEGAPTAQIQQAFQDAITRNRLQVRIPAPGPVRRVGSGYLQEFFAPEPSTARYWVAVPDRSAAGYVIAGDILARYEALGGPARLGYPTADATTSSGAAPRQLFERGAIAGSPGFFVEGAILQRWAQSGYEAGIAGAPVSDPAPFVSETGLEGFGQSFARLNFYSLAGSTARVYAVSGLNLSRYRELGGPSGSLGFPLGDEFASSGRRRQEFETAFLEYAPGDAQSTVVEKERRPQVSANPTSAFPGNRVRLSVTGFASGSTLRISIQGQPDFQIAPANGVHYWDYLVPGSAAAATIRVRAAESATPTRFAETTFTIRPLSEAGVQIVKISGDEQTGAPGGVLPEPLRVLVRDQDGNPLPNVPVLFTPSPGGEVLNATALTNERGEAEASLRLPPRAGVALLNAEAGRRVATFSARSQRLTLSGFPDFRQTSQAALGPGPATIAEKGSLLVATAAILRYFQDRGDAPRSLGVVDPSTLNQYLRTACGTTTSGQQICDGFLTLPGLVDPQVNLWRATNMVDGAIRFEALPANLNEVRVALGRGLPVLIALGVSRDGRGPHAAHFVVATGIGENGSILIHDPNPLWNQTTLEGYLEGFRAGGNPLKSELLAALAATLPAVSLGGPSPGFFIAATSSSLSLMSRQGPCGTAVSWPAITASATAVVEPAPNVVQQFCYATAPEYQLSFAATSPFRAQVTRLTPTTDRIEVSNDGDAAYQLRITDERLLVEPAALSFSASQALNAADFSNSLAPGSLVSLAGSGFPTDSQKVQVEVDGIPARVLATGPFEIRFEIPLESTAGLLRIAAPSGEAQATLDLNLVAPAIFPGSLSLSDGSRISSTNPARRGSAIVFYATGLGRTNANGAPVEPVTVLIGDRLLRPFYIGKVTAYPGVYQLNVTYPADIAPGSKVSLAIQQGNSTSQSLFFAVQ
jgi:uncharacterized protein (TIGR03437 family)